MVVGRWGLSSTLQYWLGLVQQPSDSCFSGWLQSWGVAFSHFLLALCFYFPYLQKKPTKDHLSWDETPSSPIVYKYLHFHGTEEWWRVHPPGTGGPWLTVICSSLQISPSGTSMAPAPSKLKAPTATCTCDLLPCFGTLFARIPTN